ncbi:MAG: hypothetical protein Q7S33_02915 [Nanoarchaeota archaeon]|nr:hypothetical protein [Nanoarchaeota archaeon]
MVKKSFLVLYSALLICLLLSYVSALDLSTTAYSDTIVSEYKNQPAKISLTINNAPEGDYNLYSLSDVKVLPSTNFYIYSAIKNKLDMYVYPTDSLRTKGLYTFSYNVKPINGQPTEGKLSIKILDLKEVIKIDSESNDPSSDKVTFYIQNLEKAELKDVSVKFSSVFFNFEKTISLTPLQKLDISVDIGKDKMKKIAAGAYPIQAEFQTDKGLIIVEGTIYLGEKKGIATQEDNYGFFIRTNSITKVNVGNVPETVTVNVQRDILTRLFTSFNNEPNFVDKKGLFVTYTWNKKLDPAESFAVKANTNYIMPVLIVVLIALVIFAFKRYTEKKINISKSVSYVKTKGGEFALNIKLNVKANRNVENVTLIDKIPQIVKIYENFSGSSKPSKIDATNRRIQWNIGDLSSGEERTFSYIVYSKVGVLGKFSLPEALGVFELEGKIHEAESNQVFFLSEQIRRD